VALSATYVLTLKSLHKKQKIVITKDAKGYTKNTKKINYNKILVQEIVRKFRPEKYYGERKGSL